MAEAQNLQYHIHFVSKLKKESSIETTLEQFSVISQLKQICHFHGSRVTMKHIDVSHISIQLEVSGRENQGSRKTFVSLKK
jgi:hypothetical protein